MRSFNIPKSLIELLNFNILHYIYQARKESEKDLQTDKEAFKNDIRVESIENKIGELEKALEELRKELLSKVKSEPKATISAQSQDISKAAITED